MAGFPLPVVVDLTGLSIPSQVRPILIDHDDTADGVLGQTESIVIDSESGQLVASGSVLGASDQARRVTEMALAGYQWQASIGALVVERENVEAGRQVVVNGQTFTGPVIVARRATLREISFVPTGADDATSARIAAALAAEGSVMTFEEWVASLGLDPAALADAQKAELMKAYQAVTGGEAPAAPAMDAGAKPAAAPQAQHVVPQVAASAIADLRAKFAEETNRVAKIQSLCASHADIASKAIGEGWTIEKTELAVLRASRPKAPAGHVHTPSMAGDVLEAAICMSAAMPNVEKHFKTEVLESAHRDYRGMGIQQLIIMAAAANGWSVGPGVKLHRGNIEDALHHAFPRRELRAAGFSTVSLPGILSNVANKEILTGYEEQDQTWKEIAAIKSVPDFKTVTSYRMLDDMEYIQVGKGGEIKHGTVGEESYTRRAKTYARMFTLTREDIINDDLAAFDDIRNRLGAGAAKKLNNVFWSAFLDNSSFFTSGRGNYISGSTTNLGTDMVGLGLGVKAFRQLRTPTADGQKRVGNVVGGQPEILLVPPELEQIGDQLYQNSNLGSGTTVANANTYAKKYRPVVCSWLSDSNFTGYSTTAWYLLRAPSNMAAMTVSFLNGQLTPTVESSETDFDKLGISFRGYHDFGCDQAEYLCGIKSKGAA